MHTTFKLRNGIIGVLALLLTLLPATAQAAPIAIPITNPAFGNPSRSLYRALLPASVQGAPEVLQQAGATVFTPTSIPMTDPEIGNPARGLYRWNTESYVPAPMQDAYLRNYWKQIETAEGVYTTAPYETEIATATQMGMRLIIGLPQPTGPSANGGSWVPDYLTAAAPPTPTVTPTLSLTPSKTRTSTPTGTRSPSKTSTPTNTRTPTNTSTPTPNLINNCVTLSNPPTVTPTATPQAMPPDADARGVWNNGSYHPNFNNPYVLERWERMIDSIAQAYANDDRVSGIQMSIVGAYGEWYFDPSVPSWARPSDATARTMIDYIVAKFPGKQIYMMMNGSFPRAVTYALQKSPRIGWTRLALGNYQFDTVFKAYPYDSTWQNLVCNRWKTAPILTETYGNSDQNQFSSIIRQVQNFHVSLVGNGNFSGSLFSSTSPPSKWTAQQISDFQLAGKLAGYRYVLKQLSLAPLVPGQAFTAAIDWENAGVAPVYEPWKVQLQLRTAANEVVWSGPSTVDLRAILPTNGTPVTTNDTFTLPSSFATGTYRVHISIPALNQYVQPLQLAINGRQDDGSYYLGDVIVGASASPTASATDTATTMPTDTASPTASASATDTATTTPTNTATPTSTATATQTATPTATVTPTDTATATQTATPTDTPIPTTTPTTAGSTATPDDTLQPTVKPSATPVSTATSSVTAVPSTTPSVTFTPSRTPKPSRTATLTKTSKPSTLTRTSTSTRTSTPTRANAPTSTPTRTITATRTSTRTSTPTRTRMPTRTPKP